MLFQGLFFSAAVVASLFVVCFFKCGIAAPKDPEAPYWDTLEKSRGIADPNHEHKALRLMEKVLLHHEQERKPLMINKTIFHDYARIIFVAGLEGSGHHALRAVMGPCLETGFCKSVPFTRDLFVRTRVSHGLFGGADAGHYNDHAEILLAHMNEFADKLRAEEHGKPHLHILALQLIGEAGMLSYPNYNDPITKAIDHPDLIPLAVFAEAAGIDIRFLVLRRKAYDVVYSTVRRSFGHGHEPQILVDNAQALTAQLQQLDPRFFLCIDYEEMESYSAVQLDSLRKFFHPQLEPPLFQKMWSHVQLSKHEEVDPKRRLDTIVPDKEVDEMMSHFSYSILRLAIETERLQQTCPNW